MKAGKILGASIALLAVAALCMIGLLPEKVVAAQNEAAQLDATKTDDGTLKALAAVAGAATMESQTYEYLREISDEIGARVTGSPECNKAIAWGVEKMQAIGLENVHTEKFQVSRGWTRISSDAELVAPIHRKLMVDSLGWVGSTAPGGAEAELVGVNTNDLAGEIKNNAANWKDKILITYAKGEAPKDRMMAFLQFGDFLKVAHQQGAVAVIGGQGGRPSAGMHLTHTGALGFDTSYEIPVVSMSAEDQQQLQRYLDRAVPVRVKINVQNRLTDGAVDTANVIGEIRGTEQPEQIVVVGGHLDSWDLASGATDNGAGTSTTLGAAEAIVKSGFKPRRTIRFVLFTGEEQGLLGSLAYVKAHKDEIPNHVAAVILDAGQGAVTGLQLGGRKDLVAVTETFAESLQAFGKLSVNDDVVFGTDTGPFIIAGLPGINLDQDTTDYKFTHHSPVDTFDKVPADVLDRNAAIQALTAFWIADRTERYASPAADEVTAKMLVEKHQDGFLKAFGLWPFGNLGADAAAPKN
jgi:Zn-dependent M28 family amino/carboxypeptidase